jgi:VWFA-related protein
VKVAGYVATLILVAHAATGQTKTSLHEGSKPTFKSTSTLVIVPTLVRSASGELVRSLDASHFRLTDNGIEQKVFVEQTTNEPVAVVVLMQTGGAASAQLQNYSKLDTVLEYLLGSSIRKIALVTFDSRPEQIWSFPSSVDTLYYFLTHQEGGDSGAAILDAVNCAIGLLQQQPANYRRIILLLSQAQDNGSTAHAEDVVRVLAESGTTIYSLTLSPEETRLKGRFVKAARENPRYRAFPDNAILSNAMSLSTSTGVVSKAMREDTAAAVAALSGGEQLGFHDEHDLETKLSTLADDIHNRYTLSFYPSSHDSGFHSITVRIVEQRTSLEVTARTTYWVDGTTTEK